MNADTIIKCSGGEMSPREAAELFSSKNNAERARQLLCDSFAAGLTVGENLNDWDDSPDVQADVANASDVLLVYHEHLARSRWRDIAMETPDARDEIEVRAEGHSRLLGKAAYLDGTWQVTQPDKESVVIELWRPRPTES
jgi:hypothetical protein